MFNLQLYLEFSKFKSHNHAKNIANYEEFPNFPFTVSLTYDLPKAALNNGLHCARTNVKAIFQQGSKSQHNVYIR